jgi:hypothetical protein
VGQIGQGVPRIGKRRVGEMIEAATLDCYSESEQLMDDMGGQQELVCEA